MSAPTKSFKKLLTSIARLIGKLKDDGTIEAGVSGDLTDQINGAMRYAWQFYPWPDAKEIREEAVGAHPTVSGAVYVARQTTARTLATVFEVWSDDFRKKDTKARRVPYVLQSDGVYFYETISPVWVQYRELPPEYDDTAWATTIAYVVDDVRMFTDGHCYRCLVAHTSGTFATDLAAGKWVKVTVLACLFEPVQRGVVTAWRRDQSSQPMTAKTFEELMFDSLSHEINLIQNQEGQLLCYS